MRASAGVVRMASPLGSLLMGREAVQETGGGEGYWHWQRNKNPTIHLGTVTIDPEEKLMESRPGTFYKDPC